METDIADGTWISTNAVPGSGGTVTKVDSNTFKVVLTNANSTGNNFLDSKKTGSIAGTVYLDNDGSGTYNAGDTAYTGGVVVTAVRTTGGAYGTYTQTATATSSGSGAYSITGLVGGTFTLTTAATSGYEAVAQPVTVVQATGTTATTGQAILMRINNLVISGSVIEDSDGSGGVNGAETTTSAVPVVALWRDSRTSGTVDQYDAGDTKLGEQGATFSWSALSSGTYFLVKTNPADFGSTGTALGSGGTITKKIGRAHV